MSRGRVSIGAARRITDDSDLLTRTSWVDAGIAYRQVNKGRANGNRRALWVRYHLQTHLFKLGCFIEKHCGKVLFLGLLLLSLCCVGLKTASLETNVERLWVEVQGTETFNDVQYVIQETTDSQDTLQGTETFNDVQYVIQETMDSQDTSSVSTILYEPSSSYHYPGHSTPVRSPTPPPDTYQIRAENGEVFTIFEADDQAGNGEGAREAVGGASAGGGTCVTGGAKVSKGKGKGKSSHSTPVVAERSGRPNTETTLFDDYLRSEIAKNNAMTILLCNKNRKVLLEIANLESE